MTLPLPPNLRTALRIPGMSAWLQAAIRAGGLLPSLSQSKQLRGAGAPVGQGLGPSSRKPSAPTHSQRSTQRTSQLLSQSPSHLHSLRQPL